MGADGMLRENAGRWNQHASVLFLESPPGVGFSYVDGAAPPYVWNDTATAATNLGALVALYERYPALYPLPLWLSGESYAGVYVPMLAAAILAAPSAAIPLNGILVGNGAIATGDWYEGGLVEQRAQHAYAHGLFSTATHDVLIAACSPSWVNRSAACDAALAQVSAEVGPLNAYNIEVTCAPGAERSHALRTGAVAAGGVLSAVNPCSAADAQLTAWLGLPDVVAALHVGLGVAVVGPYAECASSDALHYTREPQDERVTVYPHLFPRISVVIFNGDQDECIPYGQDAAWTAGMGFPLAAGGAWRPWLLDEEVAGYVTDYAAPHRFTFLTVKRAGHEVPMYQPARALAMLERVLAGTPL